MAIVIAATPTFIVVKVIEGPFKLPLTLLLQLHL